MFLKFNALLLLLVTSVVSPLALAQPDSGLLISRSNSQDWQIRLVGGTEAQQFSGVLESSMPFRYVRAATTAGAEGAQLTAPASLNVNLAAGPGGSDQVNFAVSVDAKLCLRDTGSTDVKIYLGDSLSDAIPVTAPASLGGIDACTDATGASAATTVSTTSLETATTSVETSAITTTAIAAGRKFHPGHYTALVRGQSTQAYMADSIRPGVVGLMKRYTWRSLEPTLGNYNFSELQSDLAWAKAHNMRLIAMIEDKTFKLERPTPAYLDSYTPRNRAGGYTVVRWNPYVVGRLNALIKAMGSKVDSHPNFEGIATQETSLGFDGPVLKANGYTPEKYRDAYINILSTASKSLPTSRIFWYQNFFVGNQAYIGSIANAVASKGVRPGRTRRAAGQFSARDEVVSVLHPVPRAYAQVQPGRAHVLRRVARNRRLPDQVLDHAGALQVRARQAGRELHDLGAHAERQPGRFL